MTTNEVARHFGIAPNTATKMLLRYLAKGLLTRRYIFEPKGDSWGQGYVADTTKVAVYSR